MPEMPAPAPDFSDGKGLLNYTDYNAVREDLRKKVLSAVATSAFSENDKYLLRAVDVAYAKPNNRFSLSQQKSAILEGKTLSDKVTGRWEVVDKESGKAVGKTGRKTLMNVPYLTDRGTYVRNGSEYTIAKQLRLNSGIYTRVTDDANVEAQFNAMPRSGASFRVYMEPSTSHFYMKYKNRKLPLYPILRAMGKQHEDIEAQWGKDIAEKNKGLEKSPYAVNFLKGFATAPEPPATSAPISVDAKAGSVVAQMLQQKTGSSISNLYTDTVRQGLEEEFGKIGLNPRVTQVTIGEAHSNVSPDAIMSATGKILRVAQGKEDSDSRDSLEFQDVWDISDFLSDKVTHDQNGILRQILWKLTKKNGDVSAVPTAPLDKHVQHLFNSSGMAQAIEEINPLDMYDQNQRILRLGEGAMSSVDVVPKEARGVQPTYLNYIDPVRAPESLKIGVDMKMSRNVRRGPDRQLYSKFIDAKTGKETWVGIREAARKNLAWPETQKSAEPYVIAMVPNRGMAWVKREDVDYIVPSNDDMFSDGANLVPLKSGDKGMRLLMGSKFGPQALPLVSREAPLVQTSDPSSGTSTERRIAGHLGAVRASKDATVKAVRKNRIDLTYADGTEGSVDLYENFPYARSTYIRNKPSVKAGDRIKKGDLLAASNFTNDKGVAALGTNLRVAYWNYDGLVFEDAIVISESAAKKLTSEHMYHTKFKKEKDLKVSKEMFRANFPAAFNKDQLAKIDETTGMIKPGSIVRYGDPLALAVSEKDPKEGGSLGRRIRSNKAVVWEKKHPGVVTDATEGKERYYINVRTNIPMGVGDKLAMRHGGKGVISKVVKDSEMPTDPRGRKMDVILSPLGVVSRTNPAQKLEAQLGKIAEKTGKPYILPGFSDEDMIEFTHKELQKHRLSDREDLIDPRTNKKIPQIFTGVTYFYKMQHTSEGKGKSRSQAKYTAEDQPAKGGKTGAKHIGKMYQEALLAHGATEVLKDMKLIKGQKNDMFWRQLKLGQTPTMPKTPLVYEKFKDLLRAGGVHLAEGAFSDDIFSMTDQQAKDLTGNRQIYKGATYTAKGMKPIPGGLFDPDATGSAANGDRWAYIELPTPLPNPIMADPMRRILGLKRTEMEDLIAKGEEALASRLAKVDVKAEKAKALHEIKHGIRSKRDDAIKKFRFLHAFDTNKVTPADFLMTRVPVLPPRFRPISAQGGMTMVADPNYLYKSLIESIDDYKETDGLPAQMRQDARRDLWDSYKALIGTSDPKKDQLVQKNVKGILSHIFGKGSPKTGFFQRRVLGTNIDMAGLGVVAPNPSLLLNQAGIPEKLAWNLYEPFIIRDLVRQGVSATEAATAVKDQSPLAYKSLQTVITRRPVVLNRPPTLHKYSVMGFWPVLVKGSTVQVPPAIVGPFAMDYDGDTASFTVPVSDEAVSQVIDRMMPDRNLLSARSGQASYKLSNEYLQGLYLATKAPSDKAPAVFNTVEEAKKAYRAGKISIDDPITILN